jgi:heptosyltransferase-2
MMNVKTSNHSLKGITVFLDRDGTINQDRGYLASPEQFHFFPGAIESLTRLNHLGAQVILITNQSGLARGFLSESDLLAIHRKLETSLRAHGGWLDGVFFCPHHPDEGCRCRKPNPGLIEQAQRSLPVDVSKSYLVGDKQSDMELALNVGSVGVLVMTGPYSGEVQEQVQGGVLLVGHTAHTFQESVDWIIQDSQTREWS